MDVDFSPFWADVIMGTRHQAYFYPVTAKTPSGIPVHMRRCCARGHLSPDLAKKHADSIARRIAITGR